MNDQTIQMIASAIIANTKVLQSIVDSLPREVNDKVAAIVAPVAAPVAVPLQPTPVAVETPVSAPAMPAPPVFEAPAPVPATSGVPFNDPKSLIDYVMSAYKNLGPQKGAQIQSVLTALGYGNINDVKPEHYLALFTGVEALK